MTTLLFLSGSSRADSANVKLAKLACEKAAGGNVNAVYIDLNDYDMPIYNGDYEEKNGLPPKAIELKEQFVACDGFFISSPEYNSSFSALLKNSLDWISRSEKSDAKPLVAFDGKVAAICAASPGGLGGLRGLVPLRMLLGNIGVTVIPKQFALGGAFGAFDEQGNLKDEKHQQTLSGVVDALIKTSKALVEG